jgi:alpha-L-glutamate ligase-like protein
VNPFKLFWDRYVPDALGTHDIMGINARNRDYIFEQNSRSKYPLVDDKLRTKQLAMDAGIQTPELYGTIEFFNDSSRVAALAAPHTEFVLKPARGSGGDGIMIIKDMIGDAFVKSSGDIISPSDMQYYVTNVLGGMYSMTGSSDKVIIEYVVKFDPIFQDITYQGVPDIRMIVYRGIPVMAMLRLPTRKSDGKANLHKGGIGVGVRMRNGVTERGVQDTRYIDIHPETRKPLAGRQIPRWEFLLEMAAKFYDITGLGYIGVDIVLDKEKGPMVLEANARPGIAIQIANAAGLKSRTDVVDSTDISGFSLQDRVQFAQSMF